MPLRRSARSGLGLVFAVLATVSCEFTVPTTVTEIVGGPSRAWPDILSVNDTARITIDLFQQNYERGFAAVTGIRVNWSSDDVSVLTVRPGTPTADAGADERGALQDTLGALLHATLTAKRRGSALVTVQFDPSTRYFGEPFTHEVFVRARWRGVSAGGAHTCAVTVLDEAYCWGSSDFGELGNGGSERRFSTPQRVLGSIPFTTVEVGWDHACAQDAVAILYCWGFNASGELGTGNALSQFVPTRVALGRSFDQVSMGNALSCGILGTAVKDPAIPRRDRAVCWGGNGLGQLGQGHLRAVVQEPDQFNGVKTYDPTAPMFTREMSFTSVSAGGTFSCGIGTVDLPEDPSEEISRAWCWGDGSFGQLGAIALDGLSDSLAAQVEGPLLTSVTAALTDGFSDIPGDRAHACGLTASGEAWCWGSNDSGQLGIGSTVASPVPALVDGGHVFVELSAGGSHTCGRTPAGSLFCWGANLFGQLGNGNRGPPALSPTQVAPRFAPDGDLPGDGNWASVTTGLYHSCALTDHASGGAIYCWGLGADGQVGFGTFGSPDIPFRIAEPQVTSPEAGGD